MQRSYEWQMIRDLPNNWEQLCRDDLRAVHEQWLEEKALLKDPDKLARLRERLAMEWAIETGILERLYTVDRGITVTLADAGLEALSTYHAEGRISTEARDLIEDQRAALDMVMDFVGGSRELTDSFIKVSIP